MDVTSDKASYFFTIVSLAACDDETATCDDKTYCNVSQSLAIITLDSILLKPCSCEGQQTEDCYVIIECE